MLHAVMTPKISPVGIVPYRPFYQAKIITFMCINIQWIENLTYPKMQLFCSEWVYKLTNKKK